MSADELIKRAKSKSNTDEEWLQLHKDILFFLESNPSKEEKRLFVPLGYLEKVGMICDGIKRKEK